MRQRITGRGWVAILLCLLAVVIALGGSFWLVDRLAYLLLLTLVLSYLWARLNIGWLHIQRRGRAMRAQIGESVEEQFSLRNASRLPKLWLELRDQSTLPDHLASAVLSLRPRAEASWSVQTVCVRRGQFQLGPLEVRTGDPFGLFRCSIALPLTRSVLVYPKVVPLPGFSLGAGRTSGDRSSRRDARQTTPIPAGVRDYVIGDSFSRIHWPTTAHLGKLMVKEFEHYPTMDVWLVLDMEGRVQTGEGLRSTEECAVSAAASLASQLLDEGLAVGFAAHGQSPELLPPERGIRQKVRILESLATLRAQGSTQLETVIQLHSRRFTKFSTVIALGVAPAAEWTPILAALDQRGVRSIAVDIRPERAEESATVGGGSWIGGQIATYTVRPGDDLTLALRSEGG